uniref:Uncharacterized protein n=1 Tax=Cucumis melo TaxID=3656 RepID=A0A9I9E2Q2_CUCME
MSQGACQECGWTVLSTSSEDRKTYDQYGAKGRNRQGTAFWS